MKWLRRIAVILVGLGLLAFGAWKYLTAREAFPEVSHYRIDLDALDSLARGGEGDLPVVVQHEQVAVAGLPAAAVFAGESFDEWPMSHGSYRAVYPDGSSVVIDSAFREAALEQMPYGGTYDAAAFARVLGALRDAKAVVLTHEHFDHIAGLAAVEDFPSLAQRLVMNREQLENPQTADFLTAEQRARITPVDYAETLRVAPGVVLLRAPGHTPGSQIVYVRPQRGKALLLIGDVAWHLDQIRNEHYRPRLVTDYLLGEDRDAVLNQMRALKDLLDSERVAVVSSHDVDDRARLIAAGVIRDGFR